jgi:hypothetical protein
MLDHDAGKSLVHLVAIPMIGDAGELRHNVDQRNGAKMLLDREGRALLQAVRLVRLDKDGPEGIATFGDGAGVFPASQIARRVGVDLKYARISNDAERLEPEAAIFE